MANTNVNALKRLCAKIIGGTTSAADIEGETIAEVIEQITTAYTATTAQILGTLTVESVAGSLVGFTKITVTGSSKSPKFRYKTSSGSITAPKRDDDMSTWATWDGVSEIAGEDGMTIAICEVDENDRALKYGTTDVVIKMS